MQELVDQAGDAAVDVKLFGKWSLHDVQVSDISLMGIIAVDKFAKFLPHSALRYQSKRFRKAQCPVAERLALPCKLPLFQFCNDFISLFFCYRLVCSMMMHGRNNGKKLMAMRIVKHAFEIIHLTTGENPVQVLVNAIINSGPREDSTRIGRAGEATYAIIIGAV